MRNCPKCKTDRLESDFKSDPRCRFCNNARTRKYKKDNPQKANDSNRIARYKKFGLTQEAYKKLLKDQDGRCAACNKAEGLLKGDVQRILALVNYLKREITYDYKTN